MIKEVIKSVFVKWKIVSNIPVPYFDLDLQKEIVQEIESRFSVCDKMEETIENQPKSG